MQHGTKLLRRDVLPDLVKAEEIRVRLAEDATKRLGPADERRLGDVPDAEPKPAVDRIPVQFGDGTRPAAACEHRDGEAR